MSEATDQLAAICAKVTADGNPEMMGELIERLSHSLGFAIAMTARGDMETIEQLLIGSEQHAAETAAQYAKLAKFMER